MNVQWKLAIVAVYTLFIFSIAWHIRGKFDAASQSEALQEQINASNLAQGRIRDQAQQAEQELAAVRQKYTTLNQRWSRIRVETPANCKLPDGIVGLLKDATSSRPELPAKPDAGM